MSAENLQLALTEDKPRRFTMKVRLFIDFYRGEANFNGTKAAKLAGYSDRCASSAAAKNLRKVRIVREIERRLEQMGLSKGEIKGRLGRMAKGEIPTKTVIKGEETIETYDERQALEDAARIHGMLIDKHQIQALPGLLIEDAE